VRGLGPATRFKAGGFYQCVSDRRRTKGQQSQIPRLAWHNKNIAFAESSAATGIFSGVTARILVIVDEIS